MWKYVQLFESTMPSCFWLFTVSEFFTCLEHVLYYRYTNSDSDFTSVPQSPSSMISLASYIFRWCEGRKKGHQTMLHLKLICVQMCFLENRGGGWVGWGSPCSILVVLLWIVGQPSVCWFWLPVNRSYCLWLILFYFLRKQWFAVL